MRGKTKKNTEFGAKPCASCIEQYVFLHRISWDNYKKSGDLKVTAKRHRPSPRVGWCRASLQISKKI